MPGLLDPTAIHVVRRKVASGAVESRAGWAAIDVWRRLGLARYPVTGLMERIWDLRDNLSACDATYVALAEHLGCTLVTADRRLAGAPGPRCPLTVIPV